MLSDIRKDPNRPLTCVPPGTNTSRITPEASVVSGKLLSGDRLSQLMETEMPQNREETMDGSATTGAPVMFSVDSESGIWGLKERVSNCTYVS